MFFPESLFQLSQRDLQVTWLDPLITRNLLAIANAVVSADLTVPTGRVLLLTHIHAETVPDAAQNATGLFVGALPPPAGTGTFVLLAANRTAGGAGVRTMVDFDGQVLIPSGWIVRAQGTFNAGVNVNQAEAHIWGMLFPIGNIQRL